MKTVCLVSCVGAKLSHPALARELYTSSWFTKARCYAESRGEAWFILSAEHGLVAPDRVLEPYERTLNTMPVSQRRLWAAEALQALGEIVREGDTVSLIAGHRYREFLIAPL